MSANQKLVHQQVSHHPHRRELQGQHEITLRLLKFQFELANFLAQNHPNGCPLLSELPFRSDLWDERLCNTG
jgi:hypothetical protein